MVVDQIKRRERSIEGASDAICSTPIVGQLN